jgi:pimeloyl-ACP methyl ester carboxylesterase
VRRWRELLVGGVAVETVAALVVVWSGGTPAGRLLRVCLVLLVGATTILLVEGGDRRDAALAALPAGALGVAAGAGIAPRHLTGGSPATGGAAAVLLAAAVVVVGVAAVGLLGSVRGRRRLWAVPVALVALVLAVPTTVAVAASAPPPAPLGARTPADVGVAATTVRFPARDGVVLEGWWVPSRNGAAVLVLHGSGSNRESVLDQVAVLAGAGYGVLAFDARGHGGSAGTGMDLGWHAADDVGGALDLVATLPGVERGRIAAVGLSMGGEEALTAVGEPHLAAVVAEGATRRTAADDGWLPRHPGGLLQRAMDRWQDLVALVLTQTAPPPSLRSRVASGGTPVLLIAAGEVPDEVDAAEWLRSAAPHLVDVWVVPGAGHTGGLRQDPAGWQDHVLGFLAATVGSSPVAGRT